MKSNLLFEIIVVLGLVACKKEETKPEPNPTPIQTECDCKRTYFQRDSIGGAWAVDNSEQLQPMPCDSNEVEHYSSDSLFFYAWTCY